VRRYAKTVPKEKARRNSIAFSRDKEHKRHLAHKYSAFSSGIPMISGFLIACLFLKGWLDEGGLELPAEIKTAAITQISLACLAVFLITTVFMKVFVTEALDDFHRHARVFAVFMHAIGALTMEEMVDKGVVEAGQSLEELLEHEQIQTQKETAQDMNSIYACYDFLLQYINLRSSFHNACIGFVVSKRARSRSTPWRLARRTAGSGVGAAVEREEELDPGWGSRSSAKKSWIRGGGRVRRSAVPGCTIIWSQPKPH
jgi:hypothetical protein